MKNKLSNFLSIILPNKRINVFTIFIIILGIISGSIFLVALKGSDKEIITSKITTFMSSINNNELANIRAFKNALIENTIYILLIWFLGLSIIGIIINVFLTYLKGFIIGFSVSSFIFVYNLRGLIGAFLYVFPTTMINLLIIILISVYSYSFSIGLFRGIFKKTNNIIIKGTMKRYFLILLITLFFAAISSLSEAFLFPSLLKLVIKVFI